MGEHDMLKPWMRARWATREVTSAKVHLELRLTWVMVVAMGAQEAAGLEADALVQGKAG